MSKLNQIQNAILELEGGAFQKLADSYLLKKGYDRINPIGSVIGNNKVKKGTPDTLLLTASSKYIFVEYTTTQESKKGAVFEKFCSDIDKCFDETKTGITINKIEEIVLCCTFNLSAKEIEELSKKCVTKNININVFGIGTISYDLLEKYPRLAKDYLGIEVDTGQIIPLDDFIDLYGRNKLATTLNTAFYFREAERADFLSALKSNKLIIISGKAGIGKSRLAIEGYRDFIKHNNNYKAYCIFNKTLQLYEDISAYFSDSGDYLIFVDDANRISGFQYIVQLLQTQRANQNFKIIATVRDYALSKIKETCKPFETPIIIELSAFKDDEIKQLVENEFDITNPLYLDRIAYIAQGNARLAVMSATVAKEHNTLNSILDVSELYDSYYGSIKQDIDNLENKNILKVAGIIAFFKTIDKTNSHLMTDIEKQFSISITDFWEAATILHDMEIVDMYENEVVKVADQVLATYLFYLVFFKEKFIEFSILLSELFFPKFKQSLIDAINPVINILSFEKSKKVMASAIDKLWEQTQKNNEHIFIELMTVFWFLKQTETLIFIKNKVDLLEKKAINIDEIKFEASVNNGLPAFIKPISFFCFLEIDLFKISLDILLHYAEKQAQDTQEVLHCFINHYGFQSDSHIYHYAVQSAVVEKMAVYCNEGQNEYFSRLFIALAENYLHTHFRTDSTKGNTVTFLSFNLLDSDELFALRKMIWQTLFSLYSIENLQQPIIKLLLKHTQSGLEITVKDIVQQDSYWVIDFINNALDNTNLYHCIVVQKYLKMLKGFKIEIQDTRIQNFDSTNYKIYRLISSESWQLKIDYHDYKKRICKKYFFTASQDDYLKIIEQAFFISEQLTEHYYKGNIRNGIIALLEELYDRNPELYCDIAIFYLRGDDFLDISWSIICNFIKTYGTASLDILASITQPIKTEWLFVYYQYLPQEMIGYEQANQLIVLYKNPLNDYKLLNRISDYLLKYEAIEKGCIAKIVQIIINGESLNNYDFSLIFNKHTEINKQLLTVFANHTNLLEVAYLIADKQDRDADYDGSSLSILLDNNQNFIIRFLEKRFSNDDYISRHNDERDYSFIWQRDDYMYIMKLISMTFVKYDKKYYGYNSYYQCFFNKRVQKQSNEQLIAKQNLFFIEIINQENINTAYMRLIFYVIAGFSMERKLSFYQLFLQQNTDFESFKHLPLESFIECYSGSRVPRLQQKIDFYQAIIESACKSINYLEHRQFLEQNISDLRSDIEREKKSDFTSEC
ncbi:MAG: hypothetical protein WAX77_01290 [Methylococcaceae bacterium]